ncbi:MAG: 50S ribosomal protein L11 methyltransferase [Hyphomicrobium sp.]|uniref:50S ribosomal protein L11 methyltransferase n=1 Tax=Hyphomicrobium sp. TaxID=82 RepID=UPI001322FACB|nr:50S ribosomal protein L11 methyltransferase [Hyphomicrobium sp.]KAB2940652.1 MAG: methyltransferase [Hyphomicrobium sp.]MBZ0211025.1 50S ribosomal protein L11 methyltransferase [Hyphomicrobium sp.]
MRIEYHRTLIADRVRNAAFEAALRGVIEKGVTTVADIGTGTGLLALMAARLGAREVFLYEVAEVAGVAAKILKTNSARKCHLIPCHSIEMVDPPKVDVVVSETLGNYAFEEHIIETLADAKKRFLKSGGVMIPRRLEQYVAPVVSDRIQREFAAWDETGFDLSVAKTMSLNNIYVRTLATDELLESRQWDSIDFGTDTRSSRKGGASWRIRSATTVYGFAAWWKAELAPGITLSTAPDAPRTHWEQLYFPLLTPIAAKAGDTVAVTLRSRTSAEAGTNLAWVATHRDAKGRETARQSLSLDKGFLP